MLSPQLTPRQAARLVDVSESTLRRWCDAGLIVTTKTAGGHRRIDKKALLAFAQEQGLNVVNMGPLTTSGRGGRLADSTELSLRFYDQLLNGTNSSVHQFMQDLLDRTGDGVKLCDEIIMPAMHRLGDLWAQNELDIHEEHAGTRRAETAVAAIRSRAKTPFPDAPKSICAALENDPYTLAPAMCSLILEAEGFRTILLGANTPAEEILHAALKTSASLITISISLEPEDVDALSELCVKAEESGITVALGGRMLTAELRKQVSPDFFGDTMEHLSGFARRLIKTLRAAS